MYCCRCARACRATLVWLRVRTPYARTASQPSRGSPLLHLKHRADPRQAAQPGMAVQLQGDRNTAGPWRLQAGRAAVRTGRSPGRRGVYSPSCPPQSACWVWWKLPGRLSGGLPCARQEGQHHEGSHLTARLGCRWGDPRCSTYNSEHSGLPWLPPGGRAARLGLPQRVRESTKRGLERRRAAGRGARPR
jgi:hypothetical protein